jgi:hypothetical protein
LICHHCGHLNQSGSNFCSSCGVALRGRSEETTGAIHISDYSSDLSDDLISSLVKDAKPGTALVVVKGGPSAGTSFSLDKAKTTIGRHPGSDIFLDDVTVSRRHGEIVREGDDFVITDVGSLNGSYLNHDRVDFAVLSSGDEVQIGKYRLLIIVVPKD